MSRNDGENTLPVATRNLFYLIDTFGRRLGLPLGRHNVSRFFAQRASISPATIRRFLEGRIPRPQHHSLEQLASVFRPLVPSIQGSWLLVEDVETFAGLLREGDAKDTLNIHVPEYRERVTDLREAICGTYVTYRYSVQFGGGDQIAREVMHVWADDSQILRFRMSRYSGFTHVMEFKGYILPVGISLIFIGLHSKKNFADCGLTLVLRNEYARDSMKCELGLMSSAAMHGDWNPWVARILLVRVSNEPSDIETFMNKVTRVGNAERIIRQDFGSRHEARVKEILDNQPREIDTIREKGKSPSISRETVLRLDLERFNHMMPDILADVMEDVRTRAPFKYF